MNKKIHAVFILLIMAFVGAAIGIGSKASKEKSSTEACQACWYQYYVSVSAMLFSIAFIMSSVYYMVTHSDIDTNTLKQYAKAPAMFADHVKGFRLPQPMRGV